MTGYTTVTNLALKVVEIPHSKGVVTKSVKFHSEGLDRLPLAERAIIANMAPKYSATCDFFTNRKNT